MRKWLLAALLWWPTPVHAESIDIDRHYLAETATPGGTMMTQGVEESLACLHPEFVKALAAAIRQAREEGMEEAGIFSACRPPKLGVGGFSDKHKSLHAYGLAVDMHGIGRPGSKQSKQWHDIAIKNKLVTPYGWRHRAEWNHYQGTGLVGVPKSHPLRVHITAAGPIDLFSMWAAQVSLLFTEPERIVSQKIGKKSGKKKCKRRWCKRKRR